MSFTAKFKSTNERLAAVQICEMLGISQGAFTRIAVLREIARLSAMGTAAAQQPVNDKGVSNGVPAQTAANETVSGETGSEGAGSNLVANPQAADGAAK